MNRVSSSDYIKAKKTNAIYTCLKYDAQNTSPNTVNPVKTINNLTYNDNINIALNKNCTPIDCSGGQLNYAKSYDLLYGFNYGKMYNYNRCLCSKTGTDNCVTYNKCDKAGKCCVCFKCAFAS